MKQEIKPTIIYIKNGVEKTVTLNFWNKRRILKKIFELYKNTTIML